MNHRYNPDVWEKQVAVIRRQRREMVRLRQELTRVRELLASTEAQAAHFLKGRTEAEALVETLAECMEQAKEARAKREAGLFGIDSRTYSPHQVVSTERPADWKDRFESALRGLGGKDAPRQRPFPAYLAQGWHICNAPVGARSEHICGECGRWNRFKPDAPVSTRYMLVACWNCGAHTEVSP